MKFEIDRIWLLKKLRIYFLVAVFYAIYVYVAPVFSFIFIAYFILNDMSEIIDDLEKIKERNDNQWTSILKQRKDF